MPNASPRECANRIVRFVERPIPLLARGLSTIFHTGKEFVVIEKITDIPLQERRNKMPTYPQYGYDVDWGVVYDQQGKTVDLSDHDVNRFRIQMLEYQNDRLMDQLSAANAQRRLV